MSNLVYFKKIETYRYNSFSIKTKLRSNLVYFKKIEKTN